MNRVFFCTLNQHEFVLVALAAGICVGAFAIAGVVASHMAALQGRRTTPWICCLGLTTGGGAWATHFIAMLAYQAPATFGFNLTLTMISLAAGIALCSVAFALLLKRNAPIAAGFTFAGGIAALHFIGMTGLEIPAQKVWANDLVAASLLGSAALAIPGMTILRTSQSTRGRILGFTFLAGAVIALHFIAMAALNLQLDPRLPMVRSALHAHDIATIISVIASAILTTIAILILTDQRVHAADLRSSAQSNFLASMSHELRTPLTSIICYAEMIAESAHDEGRDSDAADAKVILDSSRHLLTLISEILDFAKLESGKLSLESTPFEVEQLIANVQKSAAPLIATNGNQFGLDISPALDSVENDETRLRQCLLNLLSNAAKFTRNGVVTLRVHPEVRNDTSGVRFDVSDTGIGMSPETMKLVFDPFNQADETISRRFGGTGLGLSVTKSLIENMGGSIHVSSKLSLGSTFTLWIPRQRSANTSNAHYKMEAA